MTGLDQQGSLKAVLRFVAGWAGVIQQRDGIGNMFRIHVALSPQLVTSVLQRMSAGGGGAAPSARRPSARAALTPPSSIPQATPSAPAAPAPHPATSAAGSAATGGSLQNLLTYLRH
jgi:hypothetical protein